ncbi:MAG: hypothetical protein ACP59X_13310 [Solidesulfovibrio sp. DCME]|uniref:hypothetical protein n=1 Tax=Solidesulfovibrio sp. DCME TaxID=3447380 RepID=UPI003D0CD383
MLALKPRKIYPDQQAGFDDNADGHNDDHAREADPVAYRKPFDLAEKAVEPIAFLFLLFMPAVPSVAIARLEYNQQIDGDSKSKNAYLHKNSWQGCILGKKRYSKPASLYIKYSRP